MKICQGAYSIIISGMQQFQIFIFGTQNYSQISAFAGSFGKNSRAFFPGARLSSYLCQKHH